MPLSSPPSARCEEPTPVDAPHYHAEWDAGDLGCGELILGLKLHIRQLQHGQVLRLTARDSGARADIPAWCRMTGNLLLRADPDAQLYFIQRL